MFSQTILNHAERVHEVLRKEGGGGFARILPDSFLEKAPFVFDFTSRNKDLAHIDLARVGELGEYVSLTLRRGGYRMGAGGYGEDRVLYKVSSLFAGQGEPRSVHLGVDLWLPAGTPVFAPLSGRVHSFQDNNNFLDYGPAIVLEHVLFGVRFHTLYGHLSRKSLEGLFAGKEISRGEEFASLGETGENGQWPPHLHFQVISDMLGKVGDFPGVAKPSEAKEYLALCPDPNLILCISAL